MLRCLFSTLVLLSFTNIANSQNYLLLKNGEKIECKKNSVAASDTEVRIKSEVKGKLKFKPEEVLGYYSLKDETTFYLKPELDDSGRLRTYDFIEKILGGEVNLYKMFFAGSPGGPYSVGSSPRTYLYLEKGNDFRPLGLIEFHLIGNEEDKDKRIETLKSFVSDKPDLVAMINAENFKPNEENIFNVVRDYNLSKYKPYENGDNPSSSVFFYVKGKVTKPLKLIVNENAEYNLLTVGFTSVKLPINRYTKVCVNSYCQTLESSPWYIRYFEVEINEKKNRIRINQIKSVDANLNIKRKLELEK